VKYGALSRDGGRVSLSWSEDVDGFELSWVESGGPPVREPTREGFGTRMIKRVFAVELGGVAELEFAANGLRCVVRAPAEALGSA
jgi:two-component sensor histidine kinase